MIASALAYFNHLVKTNPNLPKPLVLLNVASKPADKFQFNQNNFFREQYRVSYHWADVIESDLTNHNLKPMNFHINMVFDKNSKISPNIVLFWNDVFYYPMV